MTAVLSSFRTDISEKDDNAAVAAGNSALDIVSAVPAADSKNQHDYDDLGCSYCVAANSVDPDGSMRVETYRPESLVAVVVFGVELTAPERNAHS